MDTHRMNDGRTIYLLTQLSASLCVLSLLFGCVTTPGAVRSSFHRGDIVDVRSGRTLGFDVLLKDLAARPVVFVGEVHTNTSHHDAQLRIISELHGRGRGVLLGMEMFPRELQSVLDRWSAGELTEEEFLREVRWDNVWGYPFSLYREILLFARDAHLPVIGLNAPQDIVRKVAKEGLASLDRAERGRIARDIPLNNERHRAYIRERFADHPPTESDFEHFYEAQCVWDETMGETLADHFTGPKRSFDVAVVLAGAGHIVYGLGIPEAFARRTGLGFTTILPVGEEEVAEFVDRKVADYLWVTAPEPVMPPKPMIGIILDPKALEDGKLIIRRVLKSTLAERLDLQPGDRIISINGQSIKAADDVQSALQAGPDGLHHSMETLRDGESKGYAFTLPIRKEP